MLTLAVCPLSPRPRHSWNAADVNPDVEVVIGVPAPYMEFVRGEMRKDFEVASQNVLDKASGAFTGEISPAMILDVGATWAIIGHSERRQFFGDTNEVRASYTTRYAFCPAVHTRHCHRLLTSLIPKFRMR